MDDVIVEINGLFKLFGPQATRHMSLVHQGCSKQEILETTSHTLGLRNINLSIKRGEISVIMGLSGSGKSTLIRHFNRLIDPTEGSIVIDGVDIMSLRQRDLEEFRRNKMSMVFQKFGLFPHKTVLENVAYGLSVQKIPKKMRLERAANWVETVGLSGYENMYPYQLSGGQQQRVGLARALATDVEILLMDEAFSALDPLIRSEMQDQLIGLQEKLKKTIIFITHDLDEALRLGANISILKDGELVQTGRPEEILISPANDYVEAFVKDVNRARALTVETVMKPPSLRISSDTIAEALKQMRGRPDDYAFHFTESGFQGVVTQDGLEAAALKDADGCITSAVYEEVKAISPLSLLEEVLPDTLESDVPLPVIDADGEFQGELSRSSIAAILSTSSIVYEEQERVPA
ncbi:MAG: glycine betaine/L-proline ABC transporter ATP-binding protein [Cohaesibacteraceae bacterium]|nr:glycine betaine/L-proline ABC transporter ATP-binding protein [Cohaesibacteraceae bacterium]